jgi:hypothetical protein
MLSDGGQAIIIGSNFPFPPLQRNLQIDSRWITFPKPTAAPCS